MIKNFKDIFGRIDKSNPIPVAVAAAEDEDVLRSVNEAVGMQIIKPLLVGDEKIISGLLSKLNFPGCEIVHETNAPAEVAVHLVSQGRAKAVMKGLINTSDFMRAVLNPDFGLRTGRRLSHIMALEVPGENRLLFVTDGAISPAPDLEGKKEILDNALFTLSKLGYSQPKVALLAANEQINPKIPATSDAATLVAFYSQAANSLPCILEGPIALDVAASPEAARHKKIDSAIAGEVDLFLAPNIEAGNVLIKCLLHWGGAAMAGMVVGASAPVIMTSRSDSAYGKLASIALAALTA